jgi:hypothetical protein
MAHGGREHEVIWEMSVIAGPGIDQIITIAAIKDVVARTAVDIGIAIKSGSYEPYITSEKDKQ